MQEDFLGQDRLKKCRRTTSVRTGWRNAGLPRSEQAEETQENYLSQDRLNKCRRTASVRTGWRNAGGLVKTGWINAERLPQSGEAHFPTFYSLQRTSREVWASFLSRSISHLTLSERPGLYETRSLISDVPRSQLCKVSEIMQHSTNLNMAA
jgi:hypothetical protein